jgi:hypothetical protein
VQKDCLAFIVVLYKTEDIRTDAKLVSYWKAVQLALGYSGENHSLVVADSWVFFKEISEWISKEETTTKAFKTS